MTKKRVILYLLLVIIFLAVIAFFLFRSPADSGSDGDTNAEDSFNMYIRDFAFDPVTEKPEIPASLLTTEETGYYVVQFWEGREQEVTNALIQQGGEILGLLTDNGLLVSSRVPASEMQAVPGVRWVGIYQPAYKLAPDLYQMFIAGKLSNASNNVSLDVSVFSNIEKVRQQISGFAVNVSRPYPEGDELSDKVLLATVSETNIIKVAFIAEVESIIIHTPEVLRLDTATVITEVRQGINQPNLLGLTGNGQVIGIRDTGIDTGNAATLHPDLKGRVINVDDNWADSDGHGTHVAGIAAGDGSASAGFGVTGVAPKARIVFKPNSAGGSISWILTTEYIEGARILSNSWGWDDNSSYDQRERSLDLWAYNHPDSLVLFASTNKGTVIGLGTPDVSKNALVVGASENVKPLPLPQRSVLGRGHFIASIRGVFGAVGAYRSGGLISNISDEADNQDHWSGFTGVGPTNDTRTKPDVVAPGTWILAARSVVCDPPYNYDFRVWMDVNGDGLVDHKDCVGRGLPNRGAYGYDTTGNYGLVDARYDTGFVFVSNFVLRNTDGDRNALLMGVNASPLTPVAMKNVSRMAVVNRKAIIANPALPPVNSGAISSLYMYLSGSSMATPLVAGIAALIREYLQTMRDTPNPSGMLLKAFIINGAIDMTNMPGQTGPIPDAHEGWGRVNLTNSVYPDSLLHRVRFREGTLAATGERHEIGNVRFSSPKPIAITLAWFDPPGAIASNGRLINDLNLELKSPSGKIYRGGFPSFVQGVSEPNMPNKDGINNVERILIKNVEDGLYNISIYAEKIRAGWPQQYAVVYSQVVGVDPLGENEKGAITYKRTFNAQDSAVYFNATGLAPEQEVKVYVATNASHWTDGKRLAGAIIGPITAKSDKGGNIRAMKLWENPAEWFASNKGNGWYNIVIDTDNNAVYDSSRDLVDYANNTGFTVQALASANEQGKPEDIFIVGGEEAKSVYAYGGGFQPNEPIRLYVVKDKASWKPGDGLIDESGNIENIIADRQGKIPLTKVWDDVSKDKAGSYDIIADVGSNGTYSPGDALDGAAEVGFSIVAEKKSVCLKDLSAPNETLWLELINQDVPVQCKMWATGADGGTISTTIYMKGSLYREENFIDQQQIGSLIIKDGEVYSLYSPLVPEEDRYIELYDCTWIYFSQAYQDAHELEQDVQYVQRIDNIRRLQGNYLPAERDKEGDFWCKCVEKLPEDIFDTRGNVCDAEDASIGE